MGKRGPKGRGATRLVAVRFTSAEYAAVVAAVEAANVERIRALGRGDEIERLTVSSWIRDRVLGEYQIRIAAAELMMGGDAD